MPLSCLLFLPFLAGAEKETKLENWKNYGRKTLTRTEFVSILLDGIEHLGSGITEIDFPAAKGILEEAREHTK